MGIMYPANYYLIYENTSITLYFALGLAVLYGYIYLLMSSIRRVICGNSKMTKAYVKEYMSSFFKLFIASTGYISAVNLLMIGLSYENINMNEWLVRIVCIGVAWTVGRFDFLRKKYLVLGIFIVDIILGIFEGTMPFSINPENYILVIILLLCQMPIKSNLYETIQINNLQKGMILSLGSSLLMQGSRVRGLPDISSEDLRSRLTENEVDSIARWAAGRKIESIDIVRKIPFALFIFLGFVTYFGIWSVVR